MPIPRIIIPCVAYLIGSIPVALWLGRWKYGEDVRDSGSGNAGATNVYRKWGLGWGVLVFLLDAAKGVAAWLLLLLPGSEGIVTHILVVTCVLLGHQYPVFSRFRGGKGVSTAAGLLLCQSPFLFAGGLLVFSLSLAASRRVSVASLVSISALAGIDLCIFLAGNGGSEVLATILVIWLTVTWGHRTNIARLYAGSEPKIG